VTQLELGPAGLLRPDYEELEQERSQQAPAGEAEVGEFGEPAPAPPDISQARSLLTELVPAGMGEVLVTDVWGRPEPSKKREPARPKPDELGTGIWEAVEVRLKAQALAEQPGPAQPADRQRAWETRQELRELGLLRERPLVMHDARVEHYWNQVKEARGKAAQAILDPYTELVCNFADVKPELAGEYLRNARDYRQDADPLVQLGRCYMAIGKIKGARSVFQAAAKREPYAPDAWWHLGLSHLLSRSNRQAAEALQNAVDQSPGDFRAEMALGVARYHLRDYPGAEELLRRQAGNSGPRAAVRSMLACSLRMQQKWDDARIELGFLRQSKAGDWPVVAEQCLDCVERGEQKRAGPLQARRRAKQMWKALAAAGGTAAWIAYARAEDLFRRQAPWAIVPLFLLALLFTRGLRGISGRELPGEFGNAEQGIPCWQATTWMRPRRSEF